MERRRVKVSYSGTIVSVWPSIMSGLQDSGRGDARDKKAPDGHGERLANEPPCRIVILIVLGE